MRDAPLLVACNLHSHVGVTVELVFWYSKYVSLSGLSRVVRGWIDDDHNYVTVLWDKIGDSEPEEISMVREL